MEYFTDRLDWLNQLLHFRRLSNDDGGRHHPETGIRIDYYRGLLLGTGVSATANGKKIMNYEEIVDSAIKIAETISEKDSLSRRLYAAGSISRIMDLVGNTSTVIDAGKIRALDSERERILSTKKTAYIKKAYDEVISIGDIGDLDIEIKGIEDRINEIKRRMEDFVRIGDDVSRGIIKLKPGEYGRMKEELIALSNEKELLNKRLGHAVIKWVSDCVPDDEKSESALKRIIIKSMATVGLDDLDTTLIKEMIGSIKRMAKTVGASVVGSVSFHADARIQRSYATVTRKSFNGRHIFVRKNLIEKEQENVLWHEVGHHLEQNLFAGKLSGEFISRVRKSKKLKWLGPGYEKSEKGYPGNFYHPYVSKSYQNGTTEVMSMGLQELSDPESAYRFYKNAPEHLRLVAGQVAAIGRDPFRHLIAEIERFDHEAMANKSDADFEKANAAAVVIDRMVEMANSGKEGCIAAINILASSDSAVLNNLKRPTTVAAVIDKGFLLGGIKKNKCPLIYDSKKRDFSVYCEMRTKMTGDDFEDEIVYYRTEEPNPLRKNDKMERLVVVRRKSIDGYAILYDGKFDKKKIKMIDAMIRADVNLHSYYLSDRDDDSTFSHSNLTYALAATQFDYDITAANNEIESKVNMRRKK